MSSTMSEVGPVLQDLDLALAAGSNAAQLFVLQGHVPSALQGGLWHRHQRESEHQVGRRLELNDAASEATAGFGRASMIEELLANGLAVFGVSGRGKTAERAPREPVVSAGPFELVAPQVYVGGHVAKQWQVGLTRRPDCDVGHLPQPGLVATRIAR